MRMTNKAKFYLLIILVTCFLFSAGQISNVNAAEKGITLTVYTVNDFHGALIGNTKQAGAAKLANYIITEKNKDKAGTIVLSAGDMFQGTMESNLLYGSTVVKVMNHIGFDAMTLGNHEFDWGIDVLKKRVKQSKFPYICANIFDKKAGTNINYTKPYIIIEKKGVKVGIIGIATPETAFKTNPKTVGDYEFIDPPTVVNKLVPELRAQGAEIIIVLSHLGSEMTDDNRVTGEAADLANKAIGVDMIISGHSHKFVAGYVNGVAVVQGGASGKGIGKIEILYNKTIGKTDKITPTAIQFKYDEMAEDKNVKNIVEIDSKKVEAVNNMIIGNTVTALTHDRYAFEQTILGQWMTDVIRKSANADIAFQNTGGIREVIPAGAITMGSLYKVSPFDNTVCTVELTGKQIMDILDYGLMNEKVGTVQYSGLNVLYNKGVDRNKRIVKVTLLNGELLQNDKLYKVATNDFMISGGDGYKTFTEGVNIFDTGIPVRDVMVKTIKDAKVINFTTTERLKIQENNAIKDAA